LRSVKKYQVANIHLFKQQLLEWSKHYDEITWLDSNNYQQNHSRFDAVLALQAFTLIKTDYVHAFDKLQEYQQTTKDWIFGYLSYDLKNDVELLKSNNLDLLDFPELYFFQPQKLIFIKNNEVEFQYLRIVDDEMDSDFKEIQKLEINFLKRAAPSQTGEIQSRISPSQYLERIQELLAHIHRGDIYEANFCQEFYLENTSIEPFQVFKDLNAISRAPFATFFKWENNYLLSASPERYLQKKGNKIISQPIKGTARRDENETIDLRIAKELEEDLKERSENIMIVDLVRNDLSHTAKKGSVKVEELCKIYSFRQVHQMISTVTSELADGISPVEVLRSTFPMGSMTGAPKISAMKIIEELEVSKRGLYSGAVGYFTPEGDFDFNVVIRSILFNANSNYVSFSVGGAITAKSVPQKEYEECLLKSKAMREVLLNGIKE